MTIEAGKEIMWMEALADTKSLETTDIFSSSNKRHLYQFCRCLIHKPNSHFVVYV